MEIKEEEPDAALAAAPAALPAALPAAAAVAVDQTFCLRPLLALPWPPVVQAAEPPPSPHVLRCVWHDDCFDVEVTDGSRVWQKRGASPASRQRESAARLTPPLPRRAPTGSA